jgi:hypothetical protein
LPDSAEQNPVQQQEIPGALELDYDAQASVCWFPQPITAG